MFLIGVLMVFLVLAAQYERWTLPFAVILAVPFAVFGALLAVFLRGLENDIYFQIGLVTLVGLASKNAILIVEFASLKASEGMPLAEAAIAGARLRFRPIVMTSLAFILGVTAARRQLRRRRREPALDRHRRDRRHAARHLHRDVLRAAVLQPDRRVASTSRRAARRGAEAARRRTDGRAMRKPLLQVPLFALIAGCALTRTDPEKPELPLPEALPAVADALPELPAPWWRVFDDPALDTLIDEALERNPDIEVAAARVAEARAIARAAVPIACPRSGSRQGSSGRAKACSRCLSGSADDPDRLLPAGRRALRARPLGPLRPRL